MKSVKVLKNIYIEGTGSATIKTEDQWSCKRSPDICAYYKYKFKFGQIGHCHKLGQSQLRVIIYINILELDCILLTVSYVGEDF